MSREVEVIRGKMKQTYSDAEKARIVEESYKSPLNQRQFAKSIGLPPPTLNAWRRWRKQMKTCQELSQIDTLSHENESLHSLESVLKENQTLKSENLKLKEQNFKLKAFVGHKVFEMEMSKLNTLSF